jgi:hypothetical protein
LIAQVTFVMLVVFPLMLSCGQKQADNQNAASNEQTQSAAKSQTPPSANQQAAAEPQSATPATAPVGFTGVERRLLDTLLMMWQKKGHLTSVDQAAKMLGVPISDSLRGDMLMKMASDLSMSEKLSRYRPWTFVLTNQEKLIAQYIVNREKKDSEFPALKEIATDLNMTDAEIKSRLKFLATLGILYDLGKPDESNKLGFSFGTSVGGASFDMGLRFHVFYVDDNYPFNVGCAKEALFLIASEFTDSRVRYETVDPLTLAPVQVVFEEGQVVSITPPEAKFVEGGSCGANNLFVSQAVADAWIKTQPRLMQPQTAPIHDVRERLAQVIEEVKQKPSGGK